MCHIQQAEVKKDALKTDPEKVRAIVDMPRPTEKAGAQRSLGIANHVSKLIPNMSDITEPLRQLLHQDVEWHREEQRVGIL